MSEKTMKNIPKLRFPEFLNETEWQKIKLNKLGKLVSGLTYSPDDIRENGLLVLRSSNVQDGEIKLEDNVYVRTDIKGANLSEPNDILICVRNGSKALIGKNALIPDNMPLCTHGAFMTIFRAELPKFVFQLFQTKDYERQVNADLGATINSINGNKFIKYEFNVPSTEKEQQKIADCLSSLDSLIIAQCQKVELLKEHKKGLLQNLFPKNGEDIPKFRFTEFLNDEKWKYKKLGEIGEVLQGYGFPERFQGEKQGKYPFYKVSDISNTVQNGCNYISSSNNYIDDKTIKELRAKIIPAGVTIFAKIGEAIRSNRRVITTQDSLIDNNTVGVKSIKGQSTDLFIFYAMLRIDLIEYAGGVVPSISKVVLENIKIILPSNLEEQKKIADCLMSIDEEINLQNQKLEVLKEHKKALLQQLFPSNEVNK